MGHQVCYNNMCSNERQTCVRKNIDRNMRLDYDIDTKKECSSDSSGVGAPFYNCILGT